MDMTNNFPLPNQNDLQEQASQTQPVQQPMQNYQGVPQQQIQQPAQQFPQQINSFPSPDEIG